ncbi:DNA mismatch repair protein MutS [Striga asiatica]|uniref:DNA mismatch repair protein MutS n=1 Tax=Striga asiatica TaxID=4170 RepID=A0A5A7QW77_STRAF|nr:DNA mismatch repair protein MutS [Striga asiatica]
MNPGMITLTGNPWSGDSLSPFCMYASMMSLDGSIATSLLRLVPYFDPPPPGRSSAPSKHTFIAPFPPPRPANPHRRRTARRGTPRHTDVDTPAAPQLKPTVCRTMFCSLRRLPAQTRVTGSSREGNSVVSWCITGDLDSPVVPGGPGDRPVVADVVEGRRRDEAVVHEAGERRLGVEGVFPGEADHGGVPVDPAVGGQVVADRRLELRAGFFGGEEVLLDFVSVVLVVGRRGGVIKLSVAAVIGCGGGGGDGRRGEVVGGFEGARDARFEVGELPVLDGGRHMGPAINAAVNLGRMKLYQNQKADQCKNGLTLFSDATVHDSSIGLGGWIGDSEGLQPKP